VLDADLKFAHFLNGAAARLGELYQSGLPRAEILRRRVAIFASIKADYAQLKPQLSGLERFDLDKEPLNNAVLINYLIYFHDLDTFAKLDHIYGGNLHNTIKAIITLAESDRANPFDPIERAARVGPERAIPQADNPQSTPSATPSPAPSPGVSR
jgi:predicted aminopeptidase